MENALVSAARHWNARAQGASTPPIRWWQSAQIKRHLNRRICGAPLDGLNAGFRRKISVMTGGRVFERGVSVGCGVANKEVALLSEGHVKHFDLFEIAEERIKVGRAAIAKAGLEERATFHLADAFQVVQPESYDFVHWDNALHHMLDVPATVTWCRKVLKPDGWLAVNDFVGPSRFQWSDRNLEAASRLRASLPREFLESGRSPGTFVSTTVGRPRVEHMIKDDPTEAADSSRTVAAVNAQFPIGSWKMVGGAIYHTALNDILWNFERLPNGAAWLDACLLLDDILSDDGENHYGIFVGPRV